MRRPTLLWDRSERPRRYGFFSPTTVAFTATRLRHDGLRSALCDLWVDFRWNVLRRRPMFDHRLPR